MRTVIDASGQRTTFTFDAAGRRTGERYSGGRFTTTYDAADQVTLILDRKATGSTSGLYTYTYDAAGNRTRLGDSRRGR